MRTAIGIPFILLTLACGCPKPSSALPEAQASSTGQPAPTETYTNPQGITYKIERVANTKPENFPMNSDFNMADRDIAKYAEETLCAMDQDRNGSPRDRCDVYVQPDKDGTLIGYTAVTEDKEGVNFQTTATLNEKKSPSNSSVCGFGGKLYTSLGGNGPTALKDAGKDFDGQFMYSAWEKEPGNWLVSPAGPDDQVDNDDKSQLGVWYVKRKGDKLNVNQERWNFCYPTNNDVNVDDVFYRVLTLTRIAPGKV